MPQIEVGIVMRLGAGNLPVILASLNNKALLRQVLRTAIADADARSQRASQADPLTAAGAQQESKTLKGLLARLGTISSSSAM